ncbi:MAG: hypothetical protein JWL77_583 [Chthonomonadaceae bacterium]|nr:hypothetical protein [Chthonomonadaceae bacterium]
MEEIQTASWLETITISEQGDPEEYAMPARYWLRTHPPALAWRDEYGEEWSLTVREAGRHLHTASTWKECILRSDPTVLTAKELLDHVLFSPLFEEDAIQGDLEEKRAHVLWQREVVEHYDRSLIRWYRETTQEKFHVVETVWTEPDTHRIVDRERRETDPVTKRTVSLEVCTDYRYNEELPANVFEMPPGKPIVSEEHKGFPEVWDTLSEKERQTLQTLLHRSETAWQNADFVAFASVWDFHVTANVPRDTEWKERLLQQAGSDSRWQSQIEAAHKQNFIPVTVAVNAFRCGPDRHRVLHLKARLSVSWADGTAWEGTTDYFVRRRGRGVRIVHWEAPWEEIKEARQRLLGAQPGDA